MKSSDRQLFLRHQRACVKCRLMKQVRSGQAVDHDVLRLIEVHDTVMRLLYHQAMAANAVERLLRGLPVG